MEAMKAKTYAINEGTSAQYYGIMFWDGTEWRISLPFKTFKTRAGAERAILKSGKELVK